MGLVTCPYCGLVADEGEFFRNRGCPSNRCIGHNNIKKYNVDEDAHEMGLKDKEKKVVIYG